MSILGGAPKIGKSWLMLELALRVAKGEPMWGMETKQGTVLYYCLEDTLKRIQQRLYCITENGPDNLLFETSTGTLATNLEEEILLYIKRHPDMSLIIIDTFQMVRGSKGDPSYGSDYDDIQKLKRISDSQNVAILLVHHLRKMGDRDPVNKLSGTTGISGAVDCVYILDKSARLEDVATLTCTGRDIQQRELELRFDQTNCVWNLISDTSDDGTLTDEVADVIGEVTYVGTSYLSVTTYESESEVTDYATLDTDTLTETGSTQYVYPDDASTYYMVSEAALTNATADDLVAGCLIAVTTDDDGNQQIIILKTADETSEDDEDETTGTEDDADVIAEVTAVNDNGTLELTIYDVVDDTLDISDYATDTTEATDSGTVTE